MTPLDWKQKIGNIESGFFHHVFLVEGAHEETKPLLFRFFEEEFRISVRGNPDVWEENFISFGVDEGRMLKNMQSRRAFTEGAKKIFVISANTFTLEAQNSLLKVFEEPTADTIFFILIPSAQFLLPTLLSRAVVVLDASGHKENFSELKEFFQEGYARRLELALEMSKDANRSERFLETLARWYYEKGVGGRRSKEETRSLELALLYRTYAHGRAPSFKMMLEHLALIMPKS